MPLLLVFVEVRLARGDGLGRVFELNWARGFSDEVFLGVEGDVFLRIISMQLMSGGWSAVSRLSVSRFLIQILSKALKVLLKSVIFLLVILETCLLFTLRAFEPIMFNGRFVRRSWSLDLIQINLVVSALGLKHAMRLGEFGSLEVSLRVWHVFAVFNTATSTAILSALTARSTT